MKYTKRTLSATLVTGFITPIIASAAFTDMPAQTGGGVTVDQIQNTMVSDPFALNNQIQKRANGNSHGHNDDGKDGKSNNVFEKAKEVKTTIQNKVKVIKAKAYKKFTGKLKEKKIFKDKDKIKNGEAVSFLQQRGIINGYENGDFGPGNSVNRAEATKMILEALSIEIEPVITSKFKDVSKDAWFAGYVNKAREKGIIKGYLDGTFKPEATVNQAELIKILLEAFQIDLTDYEIVDFDSNQWFSKYLQYAKDNELIESSDLDPSKLLTRDQFSGVIYNLIKQQEDLIK